jgi:hypothetical protein
MFLFLKKLQKKVVLIILQKSYQLLLDKLCNMHYNKDSKGKEELEMTIDTPPESSKK